MTQIKKFAWYGSSVTLSALMAVVLLLSSYGTAEAASGVTFTDLSAPIQAAGLTETWTIDADMTETVAGDGDLAGGDTIAITFPAGFVVPASPTITMTGAGFAAAANCSTTRTVSGQTVTITLAAGDADCVVDVSANPAIDFTVSGVKAPTAQTFAAGSTAGSLAVTGDVAGSNPTGNNAAPVQIWDVAIGASPTTVPGDGASTVALTFTASNSVAALNAGSATAQVMTIATDLGTFTAASPGTGTISAAATTLLTGSQATTLDIQAGVINTTAETVTLKAPSAAGTATITVKVTPATGGAAVTIGIRTISFTTPAANPGAPVSASVTPTAATNVTTTGTTPTITATWVDANGNAPIPGGTVTVNTTLGVLTAGTGITTCTNQSCTGTLASNGQASVTLTGGGVAGTATVTFTTGGVSTTKTVVITGAVDTLTATVQADADGAGTGTAFANTATPGATTFGAGGGVRVSVDPKDSAGNRVPSVSPVITVAPSGCVTIGATTASTSTAAATTVLTAGNGSVGSTCTLTATSGTKTATATLTIGAALATTSTLEITAADMATVATQTVTVAVKSSTGAAIQDGTSVTLVVSAGAVATATVQTVNGVATFTYVSPGTAQQVNLTAVAGSVTASKAIGVGVTTPTPGGSGDGTMTAPTFGNTDIGAAVFNGGSIEQLAAAVTAAGGTAVWVQDANGQFRVYSTSGPAFVNAGFIAAFPNGFSGPTAVTVTK